MKPHEKREHALRMLRTLQRIAKADERPLYKVYAEAGIAHTSVNQALASGGSLTLANAISLADAVGYDLILKRKELK